LINLRVATKGVAKILVLMSLGGVRSIPQIPQLVTYHSMTNLIAADRCLKHSDRG